jgi:hypothetical protein
VWATGQLAGLAFGHTWLDLSPADVAHVLWHLPTTGTIHSSPGLPPCAARCPAPPACTPSAPAWSAASPAGPPQRCGTCPRAAGHRPGHPRPAKHAGAVWAGNRELRLLTIGAYRDLLRRELADDLVEERRSELLVVVDVDVQRVTDRQPEASP